MHSHHHSGGVGGRGGGRGRGRGGGGGGGPNNANTFNGPAIAGLPYHLKLLFEPKIPIEYKPPLIKRKMPPYTGLAEFIQNFETTEPPQRKIEEIPLEKKERLKKEKFQFNEEKLQEEIKKYQPHEDKQGKKTQDAYKTLFVGRISYETTESQLKQEFEQYGSVRMIRLIMNPETKTSRGYAFVEFDNESSLKLAYKAADAKKIDARRIVVDVERARTVKNWLPRRLGGGIGDTRKGGEKDNVKYSGREALLYKQAPTRGESPKRSFRNNANGRSRSRERMGSRGYDRDRFGGRGGFDRDLPRDGRGGFDRDNRDRRGMDGGRGGFRGGFDRERGGPYSREHDDSKRQYNRSRSRSRSRNPRRDTFEQRAPSSKYGPSSGRIYEDERRYGSNRNNRYNGNTRDEETDNKRPRY